MKVNGTVASAAASTGSSTKSVASDIDTAAFLKLLTAQLQYQDPLVPMDAGWRDASWWDADAEAGVPPGLDNLL